MLNHTKRKHRARAMTLTGEGEGQSEICGMKQEIRSYQFWKAVRTEFLATLLYVFIGK